MPGIKKTKKALPSTVVKKLNSATARAFLETLAREASAKIAADNKRFYHVIDNTPNKFLGVRMKTVFDLSKKYMDMPPAEIEKLLDSPVYEARLGAVSIMDFQARNKKTSEERKKELFELYIYRHDRINNWDLVDRAAPWVVGGYLFDKPRKLLYKLARSRNVWERRTAIVSTYYFIRQGELDDTFAIAELLVKDDHELIHKAVGSWIREAGKKDPQKLVNFLNKFATLMPRTMLRYAVEKLDPAKKKGYLALKK